MKYMYHWKAYDLTFTTDFFFEGPFSLGCPLIVDIVCLTDASPTYVPCPSTSLPESRRKGMYIFGLLHLLYYHISWDQLGTYVEQSSLGKLSENE